MQALKTSQGEGLLLLFCKPVLDNSLSSRRPLSTCLTLKSAFLNHTKLRTLLGRWVRKQPDFLFLFFYIKVASSENHGFIVSTTYFIALKGFYGKGYYSLKIPFIVLSALDQIVIPDFKNWVRIFLGSEIFWFYFFDYIGIGKSSYTLRRPQNFAESSPYFCPM